MALECGSVIVKIQLYFSSESAPTNAATVLEKAIENKELFSSIKAVKGAHALKASSLNRCQTDEDTCGPNGRCVAEKSFKYTCDCDRGYSEKLGVCAEDDDLALKLALPLILIPLFFIFCYCCCKARRKREEEEKVEQAQAKSAQQMGAKNNAYVMEEKEQKVNVNINSEQRV